MKYNSKKSQFILKSHIIMTIHYYSFNITIIAIIIKNKIKLNQQVKKYEIIIKTNRQSFNCNNINWFILI